MLVPQTDSDGNDVAGIRFPDVAVPLATYTGWSVRQPAFGGDDLCDANGQRIAFPKTRVERLSTGDPRLSIEERYPTSDAYLRVVMQSATTLHDERLLLEEDVNRIVEGANLRAFDQSTAATRDH